MTGEKSSLDEIKCIACHQSMDVGFSYCPYCGRSQKKGFKSKAFLTWLLLPGLLAGIISFSAFVGYKYGNRILYKTHQYFSKRPNEFDKLFAQWDVFGIDVSEYQGRIDWRKVENIFDEHNIEFTFIRATAGQDKVDKYFERNWEKASKQGFVLGAYHYYRPNENSKKQADNFINTVKLKEGDFPPILDIEKLSSTQSIESLKKGLKNWINMVEKHYGIKPVIYSGAAFYQKYLYPDFKEYPLWVANYNRVKKPTSAKWLFWQYSARGRVNGVRGRVDINVFDGTEEELKAMCLK
jgi:lysozyme